jgi:protocatechuate 3,4-dioxygenase beta subunit
MKMAVWILAACGAAYGFQGAQAPAKGSIAGQVLNLKGGTPLKKANVQLTMMNLGGQANMTAAAGRGQPMMPIRKAVETDEQGRFSFTGLDAGKYRLSADRQGYLHQNYGARKYSGSGTPVLVAEGQNVTGIVFQMNPQAVITGKVLDEDGAPVANLQVRAMRYLYRGGTRQWSQVANANTTDIGEFRLPGLEPGRYVVSSAVRNGGMQARRGQTDEAMPAVPDMMYAATYYPSTTNSTTAVPVDVGAGGEVRGIDIRLVKTRVYRVRGKVAGAGDQRNVMVSLSPKDMPGGQLMGQANGPEGQFEIRNVPPGSYTATAQARGRGQDSIAIQQVDVVGNHVDGIVLQMETGKDVQGGVKLVDATTPPDLKNVSVMLRPVGFQPMGAPARSRVAEDMTFTVKGVPPVRHAVNVIGVPDTCYVKSIQYGGRDVNADGLEMTSGARLEVVISAAAAQVDAVVMDKDGKAAWNATVAVVPKDGANIQVRTADENGMLSLHGLKPGDYKLYAWEDVEQGAPFDPDLLKQYEGQAKSVKLDASDHQAVMLKAVAIE